MKSARPEGQAPPFTPSLNPLQQAVNDYWGQGLGVIPILASSKRPVVKWELYQHRRPTTKELRRWFKDGDNNVAVVCGPAKHLGLFDHPQAIRIPNRHELTGGRRSIGFHPSRDRYASTGRPVFIEACFRTSVLRVSGEVILWAEPADELGMQGIYAIIEDRDHDRRVPNRFIPGGSDFGRREMPLLAQELGSSRG